MYEWLNEYEPFWWLYKNVKFLAEEPQYNQIMCLSDCLNPFSFVRIREIRNNFLVHSKNKRRYLTQLFASLSSRLFSFLTLFTFHVYNSTQHQDQVFKSVHCYPPFGRLFAESRPSR